MELDGYLAKGLHDAFVHDGEAAEALDVVLTATQCGAMRRPAPPARACKFHTLPCK